MHKVKMTVIALSLVAAAAVVHAQEAKAPVTAPPDRTQLERRLVSVETLIEKSSAAKQIEASNDPAALAEREKARQMWREAKDALSAGDLPKAQKLLNEAPKLVFQAARLSAPEQIVGEKTKADFNNRLESVKALLAAQKRVAEEKSVQGAEASRADIEKLIAEAEGLAKQGKYEQGRLMLDKAYLAAKVSVSSMRSGDTLVRSLNFASKEEEYKYELDRNDTHLMLLKTLVAPKSTPSSSVTAMIKTAAELRQDAEKAANGSDYVAGIKLLEDSTAQLVRAIRASGLYIPG